MMKRIWMSAVTLVLMMPAAAFGQGTKPEQVGHNLQNILSTWSKSLFVGITGIVALMFLFNRKWADLAVFIGAVIVVGGLVYAQGDVRQFVEGIWSSLTA